jgi:serine/threonine-protein kinase
LIIAAHLRDAATPLHELRPEIPPELSAVIDRCLQKDTAKRYQDAASLETALAACACAPGSVQGAHVQNCT